MSNKTISINPSLFHLGKKTRKAREKKPKAPAPIISPNVLKNKLLKRIKEHKQRENEPDAKKSFQINVKGSKPGGSSNHTDFSDEFSDSIQYLQTLSKQHEKKQHDLQRQALERRTVRNYASPSYLPAPVDVQLDLPHELQSVPPPPVYASDPPLTLHAPAGGMVPYGVLKGGTKPCYREWMRTQRNPVVTNPSASVLVGREQRLHQLKEKIRHKEQTAPSVAVSSPSVQPPTSVPVSMPVSTPPSTQSNVAKGGMASNALPQQHPTGGVVVATKYITKKTIKRKYTLGRSRIQKKVGVLIKDRGTRKQVLSAQKDLKRKNIQDIKAYLREHNLVKVGSNAPNDVLRKMYESAMLSGEITNKNSDILLHNFSKEDKKL